MATTKTAQTKESADKLKNSTLAKSKFLHQETVTILDGTDEAYDLVLQFPGTAKASRLRDNNLNQFGNLDITGFMEDAINPDTGLIVSPLIKSLDFWDEHGGYDEAAAKCVSFLAKMLD